MKHKPIFRLALLALLLAGCGKDTTELPEGPETPATGGDAIVCRLSIGNEAPDPTDETRTAYGPLQDGYYPVSYTHLNPGIKYCIISILYINDSPCKYASKATKAHNIIDINADNLL